jgi:hypothetical protein
MKKVFLLLNVFFFSLLTFAHEDPFDGFKYGMSKEETFKVIEQKVEEGIFK